ncbi:MAG: class I SAM-dependent methyltransferase [Pseudonocardia sp.]
MTITDQDIATERLRLETVAALTDPATIRYLTEIGVSEGWVCAEVGAGAGSIARWLSNRVGHFGQVHAIDIEPAYMGDLAAPNLEIRKQDITKTPLAENTYDLIHCKILLMHLDDRERVLGQFGRALKPGGYLLVEEADIRSIQRVDPPSPLVTRAASALETFFYFGGADPGYGMKLLPAVRRTGLRVVGTDCQLTAVQAGSREAKSVTLSLAKLAPMIVRAGLMGQKEVEAVFDLLERPSDTMVYTPITSSVWARRAAD